MDDDDIHDLIGAIYEAPLDPRQWTSVVKRLKSATRSHHAHFCYMTIHDTVEDFVASPDYYLAFEDDRLSFAEVATLGRSIQAASITDPHLLQKNRAPVGKAFFGCELVSPDEYKRSIFYNEFARPIGCCREINTLWMGEGGAFWALTFYRPESDPPYSHKHKQLVDVFAPHIQRSLKLHHKLQVANAQTAILQNSMDALTAAIVLLNQTGKVIFLNAAAEHLIKRCPELSVKRDKLCAKSHADTLKLERLTKSVTGTLGKRPFGGAVAIERGFDQQPLQVAAVPVPLEHRTMLITGMGPVAMLVLHDPSEQASVPHEAISTLFGLTPSETQLVLALSEGQTLKQYGEDARVTQNTARTHLKHVFEKTKTSKQSDLVRLMSGLTHSVDLSER